MNDEIINTFNTGMSPCQTTFKWLSIYHLLSGVLAHGVEGDVCELGCNEGHTSILIARVLEYYNSDKQLHLYDGFMGMQAAGSQDTNKELEAAMSHTTAKLLAQIGGGAEVLEHNHWLPEGCLKVDPASVLEKFRTNGLPEPHIHAGWVQETVPNQLPDTIAFALLDTDFYDPLKHSIEHVYPKMSRGGVIVIDDYGWDHLPGAKMAIDEYMADKPEKTQFLPCMDGTSGYIRKQ